MYKKIFLALSIIVFCIGWSRNPGVNTPVCTADLDQKSPHLVADGSGGAVIVWEDARKGGDYDIYAQRVDSRGNPMWSANGVAICTAGGPQRQPRLLADRYGDYIITWYDRRSGRDNDIYIQRIDAAGRVQWTPDGVKVCIEKGDQYDPRLISDNQGGVMIAWYDRRSGKHYDIYAQRIDAEGKALWTEEGNAVCSVPGDQDHHLIIPDGQGGAILAWQDRRSGIHYDIYAQKIDAFGRIQWSRSGVAVCTEKYDQRNPRLVSDDKGGAIFVWQDKRKGSHYDIYSQRIDGKGEVQWTANGIPVCTAENSQYEPQLAADGKGGVIITWQDYRKGSDCNYDAFEKQTDFDVQVCREKQLHDWNIYAQSLDSGGRAMWAANGVGICAAQVDQFKPQVVGDGSGGVIIVWRAPDRENDHNIYAQHLDSAGTVSWPSKGIAISNAVGSQFDPQLVPDGNGGAIASWYDKRNERHFDIYAQRIRSVGRIGN